MSLSRGGSLRLFLAAVVLVAFGVILGFSMSDSIGPWMDRMAITGGTSSSMPGMTMPGMAMPGAMMPAQTPAGPGRWAAELAAAHGDVDAGRFAAAVPAYERVLREDPHNLEALIHYGMSLAGLGQVERGLSEFDRALSMDPDNFHALWSKGQALFDVKRDYAASIPVWERIAALASSPGDASTARGYVLRAQEQLGRRQPPVPGREAR